MPVPLPSPQQAAPQQSADPQQTSKLTAAQFQEFMQQRQQAPVAAAVAEAAAKRHADIKSGVIPHDQLNGRELHEHFPELFDGY
jgi:hypothetical protein